MNLKPFLIIFLCLFQVLQLEGQSIKQINSNTFWAGIPDQEIEHIQAWSMNGGKQLQSNWCWAASIQMVLNYHGLFVNQTEVVKKIYGPLYWNAPATEEQILIALEGWAPDVRGRFSRIIARGGNISIERLIEELAYKWPLIVGLKTERGGHALVLSGIYYRVLESGEYLPIKVVLKDPWPGREAIRELLWDEFKHNCTSAIKVSVTRW